MIISQRLMWAAAADDSVFEKQIAMFRKSRGAVDDVMIFTECDGIDFRFVDLPEVCRRAGIITRRLAALREEGIGASINVLNTIGHSDYAEQFLIPLRWGGMTSPDGKVSTCCSCPREPEFRQYVIDKYTTYAECRPDWIWVDDDVRMFGHFWNVMHGCYCELCVGKFSERTVSTWTREGLYAEIVRNTYPEANEVRRQWMHFSSFQIVELHQLIREAVHAVDPAIGLAAMNTSFSWHTAYYAQFQDRYEALRENPATVIRNRPGGGAFTDERPLDAHQKALSVAHQLAQVPPNVVNLAEIENYPFQRFEKSVSATAREASLYLAAGSEGIACDILGALGNEPDEHAAYLMALDARRPYYDAITKALRGAEPMGFHVPLDQEHAAQAPSDGKDLQSTDAHEFFQGCGWSFLGLPLSFRRPVKGASLLHAQLVKGLPREELAALLQHGGVLDPMALEHIWTVGLGEEVGVKTANLYTNGVYERFLAHPLNGKYEGYTREVSQGYYFSTAGTVEAAGARSFEPMAHLFNYYKDVLGVSSATVESAKGVRFVILGYRPWDYLGLSGKTAQTQNIIDWLTPDAPLIRLASGQKAVLFAYRKAEGGFAACLFNASEDDMKAPVLLCPAPKGKATVLFPDLTRVEIESEDGRLTLPSIPSWGECLVDWVN